MDLEFNNQNNDNLYYQHKYLKYKSKYLALKEEIDNVDGGGSWACY